MMEIVLACRRADLGVTLCTNATLIETDEIEQLSRIGGVKVNISLDGFAAESHGKFRGSPGSFSKTVETTRELASRSLLKGVLVTPNRLAAASEYEELCRFAVEVGAEYVLMNPLSSLGRGVGGVRRLGAPEELMRAITLDTASFEHEVEMVRIRFPNDGRPLSACEAGRILYVFADGSLTVCPYLVFAARTPGSRHDPREFVLGNVFSDSDIAARIDRYPLRDRVTVQTDPTCGSCELAGECGRGCPAAVIASGGTVGERDREQCPIKDAA
jgi:radical SAM protein with 4Fe4S-binding SPASM domain